MSRFIVLSLAVLGSCAELDLAAPPLEAPCDTVSPESLTGTITSISGEPVDDWLRVSGTARHGQDLAIHRVSAAGVPRKRHNCMRFQRLFPIWKSVTSWRSH